MSITNIQCLCGTVKLHISGAPVAQFYCHCDDCQSVTGGAYIPLALFPSEAVKVIEGQPTIWKLKTRPRSRCPNCGTLLFGEPPGMGMRGVSGSLLPPDSFKPQFHIQCRYSRLPVRDELPHFRGLPANFGGTDETVSW